MKIGNRKATKCRSRKSTSFVHSAFGGLKNWSPAQATDNINRKGIDGPLSTAYVIRNGNLVYQITASAVVLNGMLIFPYHFSGQGLSSYRF